MKLINWIFRKNLSATSCGNCWGQQEYGNIQKQAVMDPQIDVNNGNKKHSFIRAFVHRYIPANNSSDKNF